MALTAALTIPAEHPCYAAHFPDDAIVPAALLLQWIVAAARHNFASARVAKISSAKFLAIARPGDQCVLHMEAAASADRLQFHCSRGAVSLVKGVLELRQ